MKSNNYTLPNKNPIILAPLAGVSDSAFRVMCQRGGADLTYVEMLSSRAILYKNEKTLGMLKRDPEENNLGVQITGRDSDEISEAAYKLNDYNFETLDINMGCPVKKVVKVGSGSALLKNPEEVYQITSKTVQKSRFPVSVKIRLGWDLNSRNFVEVTDAIEKGGASWMTVHGRTRSQNYSDPVDLLALKEIKSRIKIPVIGNGNLFWEEDCKAMGEVSGVDGFMISRGALGNPWSFSFAKGERKEVTLEEWFSFLKDHINLHQKAYSSEKTALVCFRKHLLWYLKGWPYAAPLKEKVLQMSSFSEVLESLEKFTELLKSKGIEVRQLSSTKGSKDEKFVWDPKGDICYEDYQHSKVITDL